MSVDYTHFLDSITEINEHEYAVFLGKEPEVPKSAVSFIMTSIPFLLNSNISAAMRATLLLQYTKIKAATRDVQLSELGRDDFYAFGALTASREVDLAQKLKVAAIKDYKKLVEYLDSDTQEELAAITEEQEILKGQMPAIVHSNIGTPTNEVIGIDEAMEYVHSTTKT